jgi:hypothetical protein
MKLSGIILVIVLSLLVAPQAFAQCDIPAGFANTTSVYEGNFWIGFATDQSVYVPGDLVDFYLVVKNISATQQYFNFGVEPQVSFLVMPDTCESITHEWCIDDALYTYPPVVYYYSSGTTLEPDECRVWTHTSSAAPFTESSIGHHFTVEGGLYDPYAGDFWGLGGLTLDVSVDTAIATEATSWGIVKARYQ